MLVVFPSIFVADTKILYSYNFVAHLVSFYKQKTIAKDYEIK